MLTLTILTVLLIIAVCLALGFGLGLLTARLRLLQGNFIARTQVQAEYVRRELFEEVQGMVDGLRDDLRECEQTRNDGLNQIARLEVEARHLREADARFERTAERLLQEKGKLLADRNTEQLAGLLNPLRERIGEFGQQLNQRFREQTDNAVSLREAVHSLHQLNGQLSAEANNLATALRGDSKVQGDWGEWQLLRLLEASGLQQGIHFRAQASFRDREQRQKRPDFIINLPDDKHLVIDSKVSLTAYERYCGCADHDTIDRARHAADHLSSLRQHVRELDGKDYTSLYQINSPDYLLLFVPVEPAMSLAMSGDRELFTHALQRGVVIVTASTLLATLRTISYIWKQEQQQRNVLEIARQGGLLYDKFVAFTDNLDEVGRRLGQAQHALDGAYNKLTRSSKHGGTLVGRAERLRELGARTRKQLSKRLVESAALPAEEE